MKGKLASGAGSQYSHTTSERGVSNITTADAHTSAASSQLNWHPRRLFLLHVSNRRVYVQLDEPSGIDVANIILFDGENISFDASLVIYINSTNIPPIMIINGIYEIQNLLSL